MAKPKGTPPGESNSLPPVPPGAIRVAKIGGTIALIAAAAMSAQTLVALGHILGYHGRIAWLLPASLDVYAGTSIWVGYRIPAAHPASVIARRDAVLALTLTVCCNALYHLLLLAGSALPKPLTDTLLVAVGALPPLVVERIFHLQMSVRNGADSEAPVGAPVGGADDTPVPTARRRPEVPTAPAADGSAADKAPTAVPTKAPMRVPTAPKPAADGSADRGADVIDIAAAGAAARRNIDAWAADALPVYRRYIKDHHGTEPNAPQLAAALRDAGLGTLGDSRARDVRKATAALHAATPATETKPEPAEAVS